MWNFTTTQVVYIIVNVIYILKSIIFWRLWLSPYIYDFPMWYITETPETSSYIEIVLELEEIEIEETRK